MALLSFTSNAGLHETEKKPSARLSKSSSSSLQIAAGLRDEAESSGRTIFPALDCVLVRKSSPLELLFYRRIFSCLVQKHGDKDGNIPLSNFQTSFSRLYYLLGIRETFDSSLYDVNETGSIDWPGFVTCWLDTQVHVVLSIPERIYFGIEDPGSCLIGKVFSWVMTLVIIFSCICFIISSMPSLSVQDCDSCEPRQWDGFEYIEDFCVGIFTFEYLIRVSSAPFSRSELLDHPRILKFITTRRKESVLRSPCIRFLVFVFQGQNLIDLFSILPYYVEIIIGAGFVNLSGLRMTRLTRLLRLGKLRGTWEAMLIIARVFRRSVRMFSVLFVYLMLGLCFSAAAMFFAEGGEWDEIEKAYVCEDVDGIKVRTKFASIPHSMWWSIVTFTTVGYGDMWPVTVAGKLIGSVTMMLGILVLAMPISVIASSFTQVWAEWDADCMQEHQAKDSDLRCVRAAVQSLESRRTMMVDIWDARVGQEPDYLIGEAEFNQLPVETAYPETEELSLPVAFSDSKQGHRSCIVHMRIRWKPTAPIGEEYEVAPSDVKGKLDVTILRVEGLVGSMAKPHRHRDPYVVIKVWPTPPTTSLGDDHGVQYQTRTIRNTLNPVYDEKAIFEYNWNRDYGPEAAISPKKDVRAPDVTNEVYCGKANNEELQMLRVALQEQSLAIKQLSAMMGQTEGMLRGFRVAPEDDRSAANGMKRCSTKIGWGKNEI